MKQSSVDPKRATVNVGDYVVIIPELSTTSRWGTHRIHKITSVHSLGWLCSVNIYFEHDKGTWGSGYILKVPYELIHDVEGAKLYLKMAGY